MNSLEDLDWYQNCKIKIEYVDNEVNELKSKNKLDVFDQTKINTLLNVLKSPMEYATFELSKNMGKENSFVPFRKSKYNDSQYKNHLKTKIGYVDETIYNIFNNLFKTDLYERFNNMHNDEKHNKINLHYKEFTQTTELAVYPNNIIFQNVTIKGNNQSSGIAINGEEVDFSESKGYYYEEEYFFIYNGEPVEEIYTFIENVKLMVIEFINEIKNYIDKY
ncbi:hypothetical protein [Staphylococcus saprophyticus]|uniref:hypothetical protein n=1 Tax=Staphylococcus saprophyticus TaxID=29385 RepID=UPI00086D83F4|nr:hypothetical protein [Staphylococcus saprophyticus]OEK19244.1 hypothetical protein ASS82_10005 [Staphylococcus saprophyticus]